MRHASPGFSFLELLAALVIVAVLTTLATPAFSAYIDRARVENALDRLSTDLYHARATAVRLGARLHVTFSPRSGCAASYVVSRADNGRVLRTVAVRGVCLTTNVERSLSINSRGMLAGSARTIRARAGDQTDSAAISIVGRVLRSGGK